MPDRTAALRPVRQALLDLHKQLLEAERAEYERAHGRVQPGELLQLLLGDPQFAWLRSVSELIVRIDEMAEAEEPPPGDAVRQLLSVVERLLAQPDSGSEFARRYEETLQRNPSLVVHHGRVMHALEAARNKGAQ
jgi:hypothetical protein